MIPDKNESQFLYTHILLVRRTKVILMEKYTTIFMIDMGHFLTIGKVAFTVYSFLRLNRV